MQWEETCRALIIMRRISYERIALKCMLQNTFLYICVCQNLHLRKNKLIHICIEEIGFRAKQFGFIRIHPPPPNSESSTRVPPLFLCGSHEEKAWVMDSHRKAIGVCDQSYKKQLLSEFLKTASSEELTFRVQSSRYYFSETNTWMTCIT